LKRRFVATIECDRLFPVDGFFPQTAHTLDMRPRSVAERGEPMVPSRAPSFCAATRSTPP
jgi:hypothetical protein